jgi:hypothetical protein
MTDELQQDFNEVTNEPVEINIPEAQPITDAEWCFQFFDNEPYVFAWSSENEPAGALTIELKPVESEGLVFQNNGMTFKIFPRAISEETKQRRLEENASKNKEA